MNYVFSAFLEECLFSLHSLLCRCDASVKFVIMKKPPFAESNCATHIVLIATKVVYWLATCNLLVINELGIVDRYRQYSRDHNARGLQTASKHLPISYSYIFTDFCVHFHSLTRNTHFPFWEPMQPIHMPGKVYSEFPYALLRGGSLLLCLILSVPPVCTSSGVAATHHVWWGGP